MAGTPRSPTPRPSRQRQPSPAPPPQPRPPSATGASLAAATAAPAGTLATGVVVGVLTAAEIRAIVSGAIGALRKLSIVRYVSAPTIVQRAAAPIAPTQSATARSGTPRHPLARLAADEQAREVVFRRRQLVRVRRDLPRILALPDERRRLERLQGLVGREAQYTRQRVHAIAVRAVGVADSINVEAASPAGAVWQLGHTLSHTPGCAYLHGRALAWPALRATGYIPPVHLRCDCRLRALDSAAAEGLANQGLPNIAESLALIAHAQRLEA